MKSPIRIGTRGSTLALYQAELARAKLKESFPLVEFEFVRIRTKGDMIRRGAVGSLGPGIFTREIEEALLRSEVDLAVHSAKDLASELPEGLVIGAVLTREDPRDCLVARGGLTLETLERGARIGTSSLRRKAQLKKLRRDLEILEMRGNVDTRLKKIEGGDFDGMVIAHAGLKRLGLTNLVTQIFEEEVFLPQAGQGAIAVEIRKEDSEIQELVKPLNDETSFARISAERSFLRCLEGGCQVPVGICSKIEGDVLFLKGAIFALEGDREVSDTLSDLRSVAEQTGALLAQKLLEAGGREILDEIRRKVGVKR